MSSHASVDLCYWVTSPVQWNSDFVCDAQSREKCFHLKLFSTDWIALLHYFERCSEFFYVNTWRRGHLNKIQSSTTPSLLTTPKLKCRTESAPVCQCQEKMNNISQIKIDFIAEQSCFRLYCSVFKPCSHQTFWHCRKSTGVKNLVNGESLLFNCPQYVRPWNQFYTCGFPVVSCQLVFCEKRFIASNFSGLPRHLPSYWGGFIWNEMLLLSHSLYQSAT